uniref:Dynein light chain n=1 Tax=Romanomermis culicivorax TaxID=13658 RepID=A0A915ICE4_ROMCU
MRRRKATESLTEDGFCRLFRHPLVRNSDMPTDVQKNAMSICVLAFEKYAPNNEVVAQTIKQEMDEKYGNSWHVIVGSFIIYAIEKVTNRTYSTLIFHGAIELVTSTVT